MTASGGGGAGAGALQCLPGLGADEYPGFPADECPEELPDLSKHHSVAADVLRESSGLFCELRAKRTSLGVGFAKCIKTGMDNRGHPMIKTIGAVAGDEECYETFRPFFDELLRRRHGDAALSEPHTDCLPRSGEALSMTCPDPTGTYTLSTQVRAARNLRGVRFPPAISLEERREVERVLAKALLELSGTLAGEYHPLAGSQSYASKLGGMSADQEEELSRAGLIFGHPDATTSLCSGVGRHWPDARGVFVNSSRRLSVWVNEEEHLRAVSVRQGGDVQGAFSELDSALSAVEKSLASGDGPKGFARSDRLGYLTSCPSNVGTALRVAMIVRLPLVTSRETGLTEWCKERGLMVRGAIGDGGAQLAGVLEVSNQVRLGISEVETVNTVVEAVAEMVKAEMRLEFGLQGLEAIANGSPMGPMPTMAEPHVRDDLTVTPVGSEGDDQDQASWETTGAVLGGILAQAVNETMGLVKSFSPVKEQTPAAVAPPSSVQAPARGGQAEAPAAGSPAPEPRDLSAAFEGEAQEQSGQVQRAASYPQVKRPSLKVGSGKTIEGSGDVTSNYARSLVTDSLKQATDTVAKEAAEFHFEDVRQRTQDLIAESLQSGRLQDSLALLADKAAAATAADLKARTARLLQESALSGQLSGTIAACIAKDAAEAEAKERRNLRAVAAERRAAQEAEPQPPGATAQVRTLAGRVAETLLVASESGELAKALRMLELKAAKARLARLLEDAVQSGALESAFQELEAKAHKEKEVAIFRQAADLMLEASESGALEDVLESLKETRDPGDSLVETRRQVAAALYAGTTSGELHKALGSLPSRQTLPIAAQEEPTAEELRQQAADFLTQACDGGRLAEVLSQAKAEAEVQQRTAATVHPEDSAVDGTLAQALSGMGGGDASPPATLLELAKHTLAEAFNSSRLETALQELRGFTASMRDLAKHTLAEAAESGRLEGALLELESFRCKDEQEPEAANDEIPAAAEVDNTIQDKLVPSDELAAEPLHACQVEPPVVPPAAPAASTVKVRSGRAVVQLLKALSVCDRRLGSLTETLRETERLIAERQQEADALEADLAGAKQDMQALNQEIEEHKRLNEEAEATHWRLQDNQRRLIDDIDAATLKQRHALVDLDQDPVVLSARSELSTACTFLDYSLPGTARGDSHPFPFAPGAPLPYESKLPLPAAVAPEVPVTGSGGDAPEQ